MLAQTRRTQAGLRGSDEISTSQALASPDLDRLEAREGGTRAQAAPNLHQRHQHNTSPNFSIGNEPGAHLQGYRQHTHTYSKSNSSRHRCSGKYTNPSFLILLCYHAFNSQLNLKPANATQNSQKSTKFLKPAKTLKPQASMMRKLSPHDQSILLSHFDHHQMCRVRNQDPNNSASPV